MSIFYFVILLGFCIIIIDIIIFITINLHKIQWNDLVNLVLGKIILLQVI